MGNNYKFADRVRVYMISAVIVASFCGYIYLYQKWSFMLVNDTSVRMKQRTDKMISGAGSKYASQRKKLLYMLESIVQETLNENFAQLSKKLKRSTKKKLREETSRLMDRLSQLKHKQYSTRPLEIDCKTVVAEQQKLRAEKKMLRRQQNKFLKGTSLQRQASESKLINEQRAESGQIGATRSSDLIQMRNHLMLVFKDQISTLSKYRNLHDDNGDGIYDEVESNFDEVQDEVNQNVLTVDVDEIVDKGMDMKWISNAKAEICQSVQDAVLVPTLLSRLMIALPFCTVGVAFLVIILATSDRLGIDTTD